MSVASAGVLLASTLVPTDAVAAPSSTVVSSTPTGPQSADVVVHSASMNRDIPLSVLMPKDRSKPAGVLYLLNGAGGGEDSASWQVKTDIASFFANKNVYVITPMQGAFTYYTDWEKPDEKLGVNKWSTFLGKELPQVVDATYNTNGKNSIAGISSSATSVLNLAIEHRGLYKSVAGYSGCASTSTDMGILYIRMVVESRGGADPENMWGPYEGAGWKKHDPILNASKLRGVSLYLSAATGLPGKYDTSAYVPDPSVLADQIAVGGSIEAATRVCTEMLASKLSDLRIPATVDRPAAGSHSWRYWEDQLHKSWPQLARSIGA
ncbi:alpha/beta hydrolase family protein [Gordonia hydrophobica]|uniref:Alpha/beta hydrolase family protein n=1 Tax=Gordonia hydrophobica TaxID=40516 RepID=A0ABZ2U8Y5_9ACTN|nr:alpha/beta hydrolase family protein [Gordonia hydrophobica]